MMRTGTGRWRRLGAGALTGVLAAAVAIGVSELVAAFVRPGSAPVVAVGTGFIKVTPEPLKEFAVRNFGSDDKTVLLAGIYLVLALVAVVIGLLAVRWRPAGLTGIGLFGVVGVVAALSATGAGPADALPSVLGAVAGGLALPVLHRAAAAWSTPDSADQTAGGTSGGGRSVRRRSLLVIGGAVAVAGLTGVWGRALQAARFSAARSRSRVRIPRPVSPARPVPTGTALPVPGITPWRTPNTGFYRVDTALTLPQLSTGDWRLEIHGMVDRPVTLSFQDLLARPLMERDITLTCVSNEVGGGLAGNARWTGVSLRDLLRQVGVRRGADQIVSRSADGMTIGTPTAVATDGRDAMLAVAMNGQPLPIEHGFPVRMVVPGLYGYVSACKWIVDIELTTFAAFDPYWVRRGWAATAPIRSATRIDTPKGFARLRAGRPVQIAGVAWAQHRGVAAVQVQVDDGPWLPARLAATPSTDVWRQWVYQWAPTPGDHVLRARLVDGTGAVQPGTRAEPFPSGSSGWHTIPVTADR